MTELGSLKLTQCFKATSEILIAECYTPSSDEGKDTNTQTRKLEKSIDKNSVSNVTISILSAFLHAHSES